MSNPLGTSSTNSPHGAKLPPKMSLQEKTALMNQVKAWREARNEKLAARLSRHQSSSSVVSSSILGVTEAAQQPKKSTACDSAKPQPVKTTAAELKPSAAARKQGDAKVSRVSVFDRLYQNPKKSEKKEEKGEQAVAPTVQATQAPQASGLPRSRIPRKSYSASRLEDLPPRPDPVPDTQVATALSVAAPLVEPAPVLEDSATPLVPVEVAAESVVEETTTAVVEEVAMPVVEPVPVVEKSVAVQSGARRSVSKAKPTVPGGDKKEAKGAQRVRKAPPRRSLSTLHHQGAARRDSAVHRAPPQPTPLQEIPVLQLYSEEPARLSTVFESLEELERDEDEAERTKRRRSRSVGFADCPDTPSAPATHLSGHLEQWLAQQGVSVADFPQLHQLGRSLAQPRVYPVTPARPRCGSSPDASLYMTAPSTPTEGSDKENQTPPTVVPEGDVEGAREGLAALHQLVVEHKYPSEQSLMYLTALRRRCPKCTALPAYWECLAAVEEARGDMNAAVQNYERAIIKGAEVDAVVGSLTKLFDRFVSVDTERLPRSKALNHIDPKNIFASTVVKFALQQKAVKNLSVELGVDAKQLHYVVTPVRRSSRISRISAASSAPSGSDTSDLGALTPDLKGQVTFRHNRSLLRD